MQIGMIGLGRMGANMVRRLMQAGHECVVYNRDPQPAEALAQEGAIACADLAELAASMQAPRRVWLMIPAAVVDSVIDSLAPYLEPGDTIIDGGNSWYKDDIERARRLADKGLHYVDVGTSGGVAGLERGYCLMIGGEDDIVQGMTPVFAALAPGIGDIPRTSGRQGEPAAAEQGYLHCGPAGAGHFVKMVHNGIEYGVMAAYAEGLNLLRHADAGLRQETADAETAPLSEPEAFQYRIDVAEVAEVWRRGSVITSWLLDLTANALHGNADLEEFSGRVSDSGEGRWTSIAAIESGTPVPVLTTALYERFLSRGEGNYADRVLSAMRYQFGGHAEKPET